MSLLPPQDENTDPDTGQKIQSKSQKCKQELKEIKQALEKVQENEACQRQIIHDQALTIEKLKACDDTQHSDDSSSNDGQRPHMKKKKNNDAASTDLLHKDALQSGKQFVVESSLWTEPGAVQYLTLLNGDGSDAVQANEKEDKDIRKSARPWYDQAEFISTGLFGNLCSDIIKLYNVV
ncbi:hypothetical protein PILCRDRAFT_11549 [Piloderma croceum F 1598]|uniref:Uncharacterized protein n=1 Tax=Piloderma croceum (strain F 1598) TaxID=765440 RepID=A0A0C3FE17_PILCF|nr:hypothetical protein PILCRDRAFT_11549 [Piloderma croceum F 1598]